MDLQRAAKVVLMCEACKVALRNPNAYETHMRGHGESMKCPYCSAKATCYNRDIVTAVDLM